MSDEFRELYGEWFTSVEVQTYAHSTPKGAAYQDARECDEVYLEEDTTLVVDTNGAELNANHRLFVPANRIEWFTPESLVLVNDRWGRVLQVSKLITVGFPAHGVVYVK